MIKIDEPKQKPAPRGFALFALGFRPFFLAAGIFAVAYMGLWLAMLQGTLPAPAGLTPMAWHGHEMLFGFTVSVIAGFLLTAAQSWTSIPMPKDGLLATLFALWLAGRLAPYLPIPYVVVALVDLLFLPALMIAVLHPVLRVKQARNYPFPAMLLGLFVANLLFHAAALDLVPFPPLHGLTLALYLIVLMMVVMGGRVIPYFTERRINSTARKWSVVEWLAPATVVATMVAALLSQHSPAMLVLVVPLAAAAAAANAVRLAGWQAFRLWGVPLLWVLHLGYAWIVIGLTLDALAAASVVSPFLALHAYATGGIGVLTLGMMSRVSLGHTGHILEAPKIMAWAFAAMNLSAVVRVFGPLLSPAHTPLLQQLGGGLWMAAFTAFVAVYAPMLWRPRVDGKPG